MVIIEGRTVRRRQLLESPANTHSGPISSSPPFSQAASELVGVHVRLRTDTIDLIVAAQTRARHFISCVMKKKQTICFKILSQLSPKMGRNNWKTVEAEAEQALRIFFFVSVPHRWRARSPTGPSNASTKGIITLQECPDI